jgi:hypothetical protein
MFSHVMDVSSVDEQFSQDRQIWDSNVTMSWLDVLSSKVQNIRYRRYTKFVYQPKEQGPEASR